MSRDKNSQKPMSKLTRADEAKTYKMKCDSRGRVRAERGGKGRAPHFTTCAKQGRSLSARVANRGVRARTGGPCGNGGGQGQRGGGIPFACRLAFLA
jgi:hypothetical protein